MQVCPDKLACKLIQGATQSGVSGYNTRIRFSALKISSPKTYFLLVFLVSENWQKLGPVQTQNHFSCY